MNKAPFDLIEVDALTHITGGASRKAAPAPALTPEEDPLAALTAQVNRLNDGGVFARANRRNGGDI